MSIIQNMTDSQPVRETEDLNELLVEALLRLNEIAQQPTEIIADFALQKAIELTRSKTGYFAFLNEDQTAATMYSWPDAATDVRALEVAPKTDSLSEVGRCAEAVRRRCPVIANEEIPSNSSENGPPHGVGLLRHMDVPVFDGEGVVAVAGVGNKDAPYDQNDVQQLKLLMVGMWRLLQRKQGEDQLRATAEALRRSEAYLAEAQRLTHTGSWADDGTVRPVYWSEEHYRIFGLDPQQGLPTREQPLEQIHPDDRDKVLQAFNRAIHQKLDSEAEYRIVLPDGTVKYAHSIGHPVLNANGDLVEIVGTTVDITERKRTEEALRRSEAYLAEAQRLTHTGSWAGSSPFRPVYWSEEHYHIFGLDPQQGLPVLEQPQERIHPDDRDKVIQTFERLTNQKVDSEVEYRIVLPDGTIRYAHGIGHPVLDANGNVVELVGTTVDITARKRYEEERARLRQLEADLAHINRVSMMGELSASIAHEVNQPLSGVVSNGSACMRWLAADTPNVEEAREAARRIVRDGKRAADIIARIRALTRNTVENQENLDLNETILEILRLVGDESKRRDVMIRTSFAEEVCPVVGDRVQLQQVVLNLVMNGLEAMSTITDRPRELVITSTNADQNCAEVTIRDSGIGLDPDKSARIFEAFYTTKPTGMGMGLSICRSILHAHGGRLWATANDGPGTTFHFTLPKEQEKPSAERARL
jgi:PAS domain S-box-containing protein